SHTFKKLRVINDSTQECEISVGVADKYSFTVRYSCPTLETGKGWLELRAADGVLMKREQVEFNRSRPGKVNYINSTSGSMINAGTYKIRIITEPATGIIMTAVDVQ